MGCGFFCENKSDVKVCDLKIRLSKIDAKLNYFFLVYSCLCNI